MFIGYLQKQKITTETMSNQDTFHIFIFKVVNCVIPHAALCLQLTVIFILF
jgi:hypothetical protein